VGGNYLIELSLELRLRISERFGLVGFLDGGNAFNAPDPDFSQGLLWGTGVGLRYYSPIGPFRLDIGFPLDRRPGLDDSFQVYVSLGQAF
jgi:translocation and assembly module TamA